MSEFIDEYNDLCETIFRSAVRGLSESDREALKEIVDGTQLGADMARWCVALQYAERLLALDESEREEYRWPEVSDVVSCVCDAIHMYVCDLGLIHRKGE